jgi:hypothetical protein
MLKDTREVLRILNSPCREHSILISRLMDNDLPRATRLGLRLHFILCAPCRHFARQLRGLKQAAARLSAQAADRALEGTRMPGEVRERIQSRLRH